jgi:hypothetical protein
MKTAIIILLFPALLLSQSPAEYMGVVNNELRQVQEASWEYVRSTSGDSPSKAEKKRQAFLFKVGLGILNLTSLPPYQGSTALRDSAISLLTITQAVMNEDYARVVNVEPIAESAYDAIEAFILARQRAEHRLAAAGLMMENEYKNFSALYGIKATETENPLAHHLSEAGEAFNYYNNVYALFFRNYKQESYFLQALLENDVSAADQNRSALADCAVRGLEELKGMPAYNNDEHLKHACTKLLTFYRDEATHTLSMTAQYLVARDNHQKLREAYQSKKQGERTHEDEEMFRQASRELMKRTEEFKRRYSQSEEKRKDLLAEWNKAEEGFIRKHVP